MKKAGIDIQEYKQVISNQSTDIKILQEQTDKLQFQLEQKVSLARVDKIISDKNKGYSQKLTSVSEHQNNNSLSDPKMSNFDGRDETGDPTFCSFPQ